MRTRGLFVGIWSLIVSMGTGASSFAQTPYGGTPHPVPGVIQAEDFDNGGEGVAYHARSAGNAGGAYRNTDIDIYPTADTNGVYDVSLSAGEWLRYTVNAQQGGAYRVEVRIGSGITAYGAVGSFQVLVDGVRQTGPIQFIPFVVSSGIDITQPQWRLFSVEPVIVPEGLHVVEFRMADQFQVFDGQWTGPVRINYLRLESAVRRPAVLFAGNGESGFADGSPDQTQFSTRITGLDADAQGNIYVADAGNLRVRKVSPAGVTTTLAGDGTPGLRDGPGNQAQFLTMDGLALDSEGNCYVLDNVSSNHVTKIRMITPQGVVSTFFERALTIDNPHQAQNLSAIFTGLSAHASVVGIAVGASGEIYLRLFSSNGGAYGDELEGVDKLQNGQLTVFDAVANNGTVGNETIALTTGHSTNLFSLAQVWGMRSPSSWMLLRRWSPSGDSTSTELTYPLTGLAVTPSADVFVGNAGGIERVLSDASAESVNAGPGFTGALAADYAGNVYGFQSNRLYEVLISYPALQLALFTQGGGTVSAIPSGAYLSNTVVQVTATPAAGLQFLHWQGDTTATNSQVNITMDTHKTIEAVFGAQVNVTSNTGGTVTREPELAAYPFNSQVTLTAQLETGFEFLHWSDGNTNKVRTVQVTNTVALQAVFSALPQFTLRAEALLGIGGSVTAVPAQATYYRDSQVTLYARPATGYVFQTWLDGDLSDPRIITIESNTTVFAGFAPGQGTPASIITPPKDVTAAAGDSVTFKVAATGSALVEYQWSHDGKPILGETHTTLSLPGVQALDAGTYSVKVYNSVDSANASATLSLIGGSRPLITSVQALNGQIQFTISGTVGQQYKLESSPDLSTWTPATTLTNTQGTVSYSTPQGGGNLFYRASVVQ